MSESSPGLELFRYFQQAQLDVVAFIQWLVEQESMSREAEPLRRIGESYASRLVDFGASVDLLTDPKFGTTVRARFAPHTSNGDTGAEDARQLLVVGHLDTVWPIGTLSARPFRIDDGRAYGPGIFDMKAGVTISSFAMKALKDFSRSAKRQVTFLMTCDEETGSHFSREIIEDEARSAVAALVLEPPIPGGTVKTARKGVGEFELIIRGRPAHAGNDPRAGISAITELANQVLAVNKLCDYSRGTTLNVGVVKGGVLSNVIAAEARASIDMRYQTEDEGQRIVNAMQSLEPALKGARIEVRGGINRPPLVRTPAVASLFEHARTLAAELGYDLKEGAVGGGSDGNFIAALGVPVLDGLGVDGAGAHAEHEHIIVDDIPRRAAIVTRLIETI
ncbi:MAG TPA: M20 family metallopeptidase [Blastocatellia bacterium]|nr:M20 family metallopeptidase [Blastocatellia bacterium]